ncbi:MAG: T9SS type A sorting domain-containing protein [Bacteroidetes bacterium]|nr:T9SS type A sorting domain-containing protein [Bacteroidota bacterium]
MKNPVSFLFVFLFPFVINAQNTFTKEYEIWNEFSMNNFQQTSDGGYILCTDADPEMDTATSLDQGYLIKMNVQGTTEWIKKYAKSTISIKANDGNSVFQTADGGYIVATVYYYNSSVGTIHLMKTDNVGNISWEKLYPAYQLSSAFCVKQTSDLGYIICGGTTDTLSMFPYYTLLLKTDNLGNVQWGKKFLETSIGQSGPAFCVNQSADGGYILCCTSGTGTAIIKTDATGNIQWNKIISTNGYDGFYDVHQTTDGGYIATGYSLDAVTSYGYAFLLKLNASGNFQWGKKYQDPTNYLTGFSTRQTSDGGYIISSGDANYFSSLIKTDSTGILQWVRDYNPLVCFNTSEVTLTSDHGYAFVTGWASGTWSDWRVAIVKTDSLGHTATCGEASPNYYTLNYSPAFTSGFSTDTATVTLGVATTFGISNVAEYLPCYSFSESGVIENQMENNGISIFPNPSSGKFTVLLPSGNCSLLIYDVTGKLIRKKFLNEKKNDIDLSSEAPGMYFYRIANEEKISAQGKIIIE